jgi:hypothetical protein
MFNFSLQDSATLHVEVVPVLWCTLQSPSAGGMRQKEDVIQYVSLAKAVRVGMWRIVQLVSIILYIPPLICSPTLFTLKMVTAVQVRIMEHLQPHNEAKTWKPKLQSRYWLRESNMSACLIALTCKKTCSLKPHHEISL